MKRFLILVCLALVAVSCTNRNVKSTVQKNAQPCECKQQPAPIQLPDNNKSNGDIKPTSIITPDYALLKPAAWSDIDGFAEDDLSAAWPVWLKSCDALKNKPSWQSVCASAQSMLNPSSTAIQAYFTQNFNVYRTSNQDGNDTGLITGYYEPLLKGSRTKSVQFPHPIYRQPNDLVSVELGELYPELKYKRVRGKLVGNKLVPYMTRAEIETSPSPMSGAEIMWIDDIIDVFFLQIQGSGLIQLENGEQVHLGYADQNGHPYNSIGRLLVERGELTFDQASMQGIKNWARNNLAKLRELLNSNPSYVFFRELPAGLSGPLGALGVPITAERSVAIDPKYVPLGSPIFLSTTQPNNTKPLKRMMMAQDTGGAIKGGVRADFFWGAGNEAGKQAGAMKQTGRIWVLLPKDFTFPSK